MNSPTIPVMAACARLSAARYLPCSIPWFAHVYRTLSSQAKPIRNLPGQNAGVRATTSAEVQGQTDTGIKVSEKDQRTDRPHDDAHDQNRPLSKPTKTKRVGGGYGIVRSVTQDHQRHLKMHPPPVSKEDELEHSKEQTPVRKEIEPVERWNPDAPSGPEFGGPRGYEPTKFGDWSKNGRVTDF